MKKLGLILVFSAALAALGTAQGQQRGQGFRMQGMDKIMEYGLLQRPDVKKDLKITDEESTKLEAARADMQSQMMQTAQEAQGDQEAMQAGFKKVMDGMGTTIKGILTPAQTTRLHEINIQMQGASLLTDPDMQKTLKFTDAQTKQVKELQDKQQEANASLMEKVRNGDIDRSEIGPMFQKNTEALKVAVEKVLTDEQRAQFKKMGGAPFEKDPNYKPQGFGFGGGRGGGGGGGN